MPNRASLLLPLLASVALGQTTHVVSGGGNTLQLAINAAAPGDILDVLPGSYSPVTATRGLRILLRSGARVEPPVLQLTPAFTIAGLPANEAFVVIGGAAYGFDISNCAGAVVCNRTLAAPITGSSLRITGCTGPVAFQGVDGAGSLPAHGPTMVITNCSQVSFTSGRLPRTIVTNSAVSLRGIEIRPYGGSMTPGTLPSLRLVSGSLEISGGDIRGGVAASLPFTEPGLTIDQGTVRLTGAAIVQASIDWGPPTIEAIRMNGGTLFLDPSVVLVGAPPILGPGTVVSGWVPSLAVAHVPGSSGYQVGATAEPASLVFTLLGLPTPVLPLPWGDAWLDPVSPILDVTVAPPSGTWSFTRSLTAVPPFLGLVVQSVALSPNNTIVIGPPVRFIWD